VDPLLRVRYYPSGEKGPVQEYLRELKKERSEAAARLALDIELLGAEGTRSTRISIRGLGGGLLELRRLFEGVWYRIFFWAGKGDVWLLHALEKKSAKTPLQDVELARKRMKEVRV
jgi:phage-related protein